MNQEMVDKVLMVSNMSYCCTKSSKCAVILQSEPLCRKQCGIILSNITFDIKKGSIVTLVGPNGGGKTTLIKIILGIVPQTIGSVVLNARVAYVPQKIAFNFAIPMKIGDFMDLQLHQNIGMMEALTMTGFNTSAVNKCITKLSIGEMQRILIARAIMSKPELLVLDEPTQGLDIRGQGMVYELIRRIQSEWNTSTLIASHDLQHVLANSDMVLCINKTVQCIGKPQDTCDSVFKYLAHYTHDHN
jgi:zinc transport system ATP-binding protein